MYLYLSRIGDIETIVTGDCWCGGDKFAWDYANNNGIELNMKCKRDPKTNQIMPDYIDPEDFYTYYEFTQICYNRNEEIAKEPLDYLIALVAPDRKGGTENTIKHFKKYHKDWENKLILL